MFTVWLQIVHQIRAFIRNWTRYDLDLSMQVDTPDDRPPNVVPRYRRVADALRAEIEQGVYPRASRLPSEHELAARHGVARGTIRQALATLRAEGAISVRPGARHVVLGPARTQSFSELQSFTSWARRLGDEPTGRVVELGLRPAAVEEAAALGLRPGDELLGLVRVRLLGGRPVMVERTAFVAQVAPLVVTAELEAGSIYDQLAHHGIEIVQARHTIDAVAAGTTDARLLGVPRRAPLLRDRRAGLDRAGVALEWSDDRYRPESVVFGVDNAVTASPLTRRSTREPGAADVHRLDP
jgi:GntR family transcriptional regulator